MNFEEFERRLLAHRNQGEWQSECLYLRDFGNEMDAGMKATEISVRVGREFEAYPCWYCGGWHIGRAITGEEPP